MGNISYLDMVNVMKNYYTGTATPDAWVQFTQGGITPEKMQLLEQAGVSATLSPSGNVLGYDYNGALPAVTNPATAIDSNLNTGAYGAGSYNALVPGTAITDQQTGTTTMQSGVKAVSGGATIASVADKVSLGVAGVALGTKLGALIDGALYSLDPSWWDHNYPTINPATWDDLIAGDNETGQWVVRSIFGLPDDQSNNGTLYMDERLLAYTYALLLEEGAWNSGAGDSTATIDDTTGLSQTTINHMPFACANDLIFSNGYKSGQTPLNTDPATSFYTGSSASPLHYFTIQSSNGQISSYVCSLSPFNFYGYIHNRYGQYSTRVTSRSATINGKTVYYQNAYSTIPASEYVCSPSPIMELGDSLDKREVAYVILYGDITTPEALPGVNPNNPEASTYITPSNVINVNTGQPITPQDSIDDILQALKIAYPALFADELFEDVMQPDGTIDRITYTPVPYPDMEDPTKPTTDTTPGVDPQTNPEYNPESRPEDQTQGLTDSLTESPTTPDTGSGTTPPFLPPDGTANALYAIYNPSQGELNSFGAWLWSSNFVDQLLKLFNDPMQAIIGLHKVFVNPVISGRQNIKVGYLDSGVASNVVGAQYVTVDCGSVSIPEYFGNVFDYDPFTQIYLYLPFVGIQRLDTGDVMRGTLNVVYHCDVLTGACLVEVNVLRDGGGGIIYTYTGNCAVQYPISSGSYMGIIASLASVVGGVVGTIATGGALAPVALGAVSGVMNAHTRVEHSGGFSGNAGAMGIKKPYVIITRPQTCLADDFPAFNGYPANKLTYIADCTGYIKCDECHIEQIPGTDAELSELENLLKSGIII